MRGELPGRAVGTGANISAYNDVTFILRRRTIDCPPLPPLLLIQPVFILSAGGVTQCQEEATHRISAAR